MHASLLSLSSSSCPILLRDVALALQRKRAVFVLALYNVVPLFSKSGTLIFAFFRYNYSRKNISHTSITRHAFVVPSIPRAKRGGELGGGKREVRNSS